MDTRRFARLTDTQLISEVHSLAAGERAASAALIAAIGEVDVRQLYLDLGYSSLFVFCTERLHLTDENHAGVLRAAIHKSKREVERQVAALSPQPPVATLVRRLPTPTSAAVAGSGTPATTAHGADVAGSNPVPQDVIARAVPPVRPAIVAALSPERYKVQLTITRDTHDKLRRRAGPDARRRTQRRSRRDLRSGTQRAPGCAREGGDGAHIEPAPAPACAPGITPCGSRGQAGNNQHDADVRFGAWTF